ncbi:MULTISPECIES: hypothetical protein [Thiomicrorhabdus]|uniref:Ankyrin repeat domain-containing protein n=1 Tax=Thiomicrorhabdus heinhorstiae TaxID=2748010 RepID=A0ABS0C1I8_9GAMM|nr:MULTISPECIES: hypothetical protein [Thiomicrorhabdus]MBF6058956.1 hypothetical protein [Thiomicrorhabdus heinhorstiae]
MNLLNLDEKNRASFSNIVKTLVLKHNTDPKEMFLHALESEAEPEMNYWMTMVLVQEYFVSPQLEVGKDAAGESVKALQAACLLKNVGVTAALLELGGFSGGVTGKEYQLAARIASQHEDQAVLGLLMKYAQEKDVLEPFMRSLQGATLQ